MSYVGKVKTIHTRGFFFVEVPGLGDCFVHAQSLPRGFRNLDGIDIGMEMVVDDVSNGAKGLRASRARLKAMPEQVDAPQRTTNLFGTIARLRPDRGFGWVRSEPSGEFYFHCSSVTGARRFNDLREGDAVVFDIEQSERGPRAASVQYYLDESNAA